MSSKKNTNRTNTPLVPHLRFPQFKSEGGWVQKTLGELGDIITGNTPSTTNSQLWNGDILFITPTDISEHKYQVATQRTVAKQKGLRVLSHGSIVYSCIASIGKIAVTTKDSITNQQINSIEVKQSIYNEFVYYLLVNETPRIKLMPPPAALGIINRTAFSKINIAIPKKKQEQQKIADCLSSLDRLIEAQQHKLAALQQHKKGLVQQLFPAEGKTIPALRFPQFMNDGEWNTIQLEKCLDYLRPDKYIVNDTEYSKEYNTPVLTAGKSFILGHTNETNGVFSVGLPVIIFDDFTTASQYVDFPFKVKSGAIKILLAREGYNIKFMYEIMQTIIYEVKEHKRYWISEYSKLPVFVPSFKEQQTISNCLSYLDLLIEDQQHKIESLKKHKKGLMQQLFPSTEGI